MDDTIQDVAADSPSDAAEQVVAGSSPAEMETSGAQPEHAGSVSTPDVATEAQPEGEVDPLEGVPTIEELREQAAKKIPYAAALERLRPAYEGVKSQLDGYKSLDPWKPVAETIGDPAVAQSYYELVSAIHTPDANSTSGFSSAPFLRQLDEQSPGTVEQIAADALRFHIPDPQGRPSTVVRELYRSHGLDPDRMDDYRNIDKLRASSGLVTAEQLSQIDPQYQDAFKSFSQATREDLLALKEHNPAAAEEYLRNAQGNLETQQWREQQEQAARDTEEREQAQFQQQLQETIQSDLLAEARGIHDSISKDLAAITFSSDATENKLEQVKIMATLATLQNPAYRWVAEEALKTVGVDPSGFDELANRWETRRSAQKYYEAIGDQMQMRQAASDATAAKQQMLIKLGSWAQKLAKSSGNRLASAAAQQSGQLAAASARFVPSGAGQAQQGAENPYAQNPHRVGSPEYYAYYKDLDKQFKVDGASMFGN
jgi:hypothetical protein